MPTPIIPIGWQAKTYRNTGTLAVPVWNLLGAVGDLTPINEYNSFDSTTKDDLGIETEIPTTRKGGFDATILYDTAGDDLAVLIDAFNNRTSIEFAVCDGTITTTGTRIRRINGVLMKMPVDQKVKEGLTYNLNVRPTPNDGTVAPVRDSVAA